MYFFGGQAFMSCKEAEQWCPGVTRCCELLCVCIKLPPDISVCSSTLNSQRKKDILSDKIPATLFSSLGCTCIHHTEPSSVRFCPFLAASGCGSWPFSSDGACCALRCRVMDASTWGNKWLTIFHRRHFSFRSVPCVRARAHLCVCVRRLLHSWRCLSRNTMHNRAVIWSPS